MHNYTPERNVVQHNNGWDFVKMLLIVEPMFYAFVTTEQRGVQRSGASLQYPYCARTFAQVSLSVMVRLKTNISGVESGSTQK